MKDAQVEIYGQVYKIRGELDPAYIEQLARTVDAKIRALARQTDTVDTRRLAVLAALNLADELQQARAKAQEPRPSWSREFSTRLEACHRLLDSALAPGSGG